ncbi:hypothetical protein JR316_0008624 [Psilocybe cubensis]|uniref:Uncharacterized protein n=2 Tax=Psilocybe cubensis TaxID=181762 RepID=A0ACB8GRH7_PSICU|nr:hypothetical protein JR316_0008624 [Psilocybe cubensis]KAH9478171.1 hypothetical protein JR316_0008624 [Psilocybe cubensis]
MSSSTSVPSQVTISNRIISANLNGTMILTFLMGFYTLVYFGTMYLYLSRKPANTNSRIVLVTISVLYFLSFLGFIVQWYFTDWSVVIHGETRESMFWALMNLPLWIGIINNIQLNALFVISDGLLIWRCYHVWGQSFKVIFAPLVLLATEFCLAVAAVALQIMYGHIASEVANVALENHMSSAAVFVSLGTTLITTFLIGYRIHTASLLNKSPSQKLYNRIVVTIIESSAVYSLVLLAFAITLVIRVPENSQSLLTEATYYSEAVLLVVTGMAPTVMVARIALTNPSALAPSATSHISGLAFQSDQEWEQSHCGEYTNGNLSNTVHTDLKSQSPIIDFKKTTESQGLDVTEV